MSEPVVDMAEVYRAAAILAKHDIKTPYLAALMKRVRELETFAGELVLEIRGHINETGEALPRDIHIAYLHLEAALEPAAK